MKHTLSFALIRILTFPAVWLPYPAVQYLGKQLGSLAYYLIPHYRKRALSNLALAIDLRLTNEEIVSLAKKSFQNLFITCLEYPKLANLKKASDIAHCENHEEADRIMKEGKGLIFFCAHQANWEVLFLEGTARMPGIAIGRPIKNSILYDWILEMREQFGGKIVNRQNSIKEGLRALRAGKFLGIVGDQGMPDSGYSSPFFGRRAWTSPMPAILSYRTGAPIIVATTKRGKDKYYIHYSDPIYPNNEEPMEKEIDRMMRKSLKLLEESISMAPGEWLWQHNRWKQQTLDKIKRPFRYESICIVLPEEKELFDEIAPHLATFRELYPYEFITLRVPQHYNAALPDAEIIPYSSEKDLLVKDYRFKLIFNFSKYKKVREHFLNLSAFTVADLEDLKKLAGTHKNFSELLQKAITHAG